MGTGNRKIAFIGALLLAIFSWYWCGITLFAHQHDMDGVRVTHSHPLAGSSHSHTSSQLQTISFLAMFFALVGVAGFALINIGGFKSEIEIDTTEQATSITQLAYSLRAPPALLL